jgi:hypothetical protein
MAVIAPFFEQKRIWWPLIPGGILGIVGVLMFLGDAGSNILEALGTIWPLFLVIIGLYILIVPREHRYR